MGFLSDFETIQLSELKETVKVALDNNYNVFLTINGELYLIESDEKQI
jgi:hypothetical protein